jgi:hypothetical protein
MLLEVADLQNLHRLAAPERSQAEQRRGDERVDEPGEGVRPSASARRRPRGARDRAGRSWRPLVPDAADPVPLLDSLCRALLTTAASFDRQAWPQIRHRTLGPSAWPGSTSHRRVPDEIGADEEDPGARGAVGKTVTLGHTALDVPHLATVSTPDSRPFPPLPRSGSSAPVWSFCRNRRSGRDRCIARPSRW